MDVSDETGPARDHEVTLSICLRCRDGAERGDDDERGGTRFARAILAERDARLASLPAHTVRGVRCMSQCKRPCTVALSAPGRFTYLFGDLDPRHDAAAVITLLTQYASIDDGFLPRDQRPEAMRAGILGRIPPLGIEGDLVTTLRTPTPSTAGEPA